MDVYVFLKKLEKLSYGTQGAVKDFIREMEEKMLENNFSELKQSDLKLILANYVTLFPKKNYNTDFVEALQDKIELLPLERGQNGKHRADVELEERSIFYQSNSKIEYADKFDEDMI